MKNWMTEAARHTLRRAPLLTADHAREIAGDLYRAWPNDTPAVAVAKFFRAVPTDWKRHPLELAEAA